MQSLQNVALRSASRVRTQASREIRRHASDSHEHGHGNHHVGPTTESFGLSFYVAIAALPASLVIYNLTTGTPENQPYFTRLITSTYQGLKSQFADRNALHTHAIEQAAADRSLFLNESNRNVRNVPHRFPEQVNGGSPWNVPAGHGSANVDELIAKFAKERDEAQAEKMAQIKENRVPIEQPFESFIKKSPAANDS